jgi:hypothetical protein
VQIGNGADEVRLSGGTLQTDGVAAVIHLTTGVTISDVMIRQTPVAGGAPHSGVVIPDGHTASFENEIINDGVITIAASSSETRLLAAGNEPQVAGQGRIELTDENLAVLGETKGGGTCPPPAAQNLTVVGEAQVIEGEGLVSGPLENFGRIVANRLRKKLRLENSYYINRGELGAENGGIMVIRCARVDQSGSMNTPADPHGLIRAGQGSSVWIEQSTIGALTVPGNAVAAGGTISLNGVVAVFNMCTGNGIPPGPFGLFYVQSSSDVTISTCLDVMGGEFHVLGSTLEAPTATVGFDARLTTDGGIMVDHVSTASSGINLMSLETGRGSTVKAVMLEILQPGEAHFSGRVELGGGFVFDNINPAEVDWAEGSELVFSPGSDATLEVGGTEFPLKTLRIEKGAEVTLQTMHHPPDSALFVGQIIIGPDATLDCNGISVFADSCSCADVSVPCSMVDGCFSCPPPPP